MGRNPVPKRQASGHKGRKPFPRQQASGDRGRKPLPKQEACGDKCPKPVPEERQEYGFEYEFPPEHIVPVEKLETMKDNEQINMLMKSANLREWIHKVYECPSPHLFKKAMCDPEFRAFSNAVLVIAGVSEDYNLD